MRKRELSVFKCTKDEAFQSPGSKQTTKHLCPHLATRDKTTRNVSQLSSSAAGKNGFSALASLTRKNKCLEPFENQPNPQNSGTKLNSHHCLAHAFFHKFGTKTPLTSACRRIRIAMQPCSTLLHSGPTLASPKSRP